MWNGKRQLPALRIWVRLSGGSSKMQIIFRIDYFQTLPILFQSHQASLENRRSRTLTTSLWPCVGRSPEMTEVVPSHTTSSKRRTSLEAGLTLLWPTTRIARPKLTNLKLACPAWVRANGINSVSLPSTKPESPIPPRIPNLTCVDTRTVRTVLISFQTLCYSILRVHPISVSPSIDKGQASSKKVRVKRTAVWQIKCRGGEILALWNNT